MGQAGRRHARANFSLAHFGAKLDAIVDDLMRCDASGAPPDDHQRPRINNSQSSTTASAAPGVASRRAADDIAA